MKNLVVAASEIQAQFDEAGLPNCIIGGLAVQVWGEPRVTRDADFSLLCELDEIDEVVEQIFKIVPPRVGDPVQFALKNRVALGVTRDGVPVDVGIATFPTEHEMIARAVEMELLSGLICRICCPEDLVLMKLVANRPQDLMDVKSIIARQWGKVDLKLIRKRFMPFVEALEVPELIHQFDQIVKFVRKQVES